MRKLSWQEVDILELTSKILQRDFNDLEASISNDLVKLGLVHHWDDDDHYIYSQYWTITLRGYLVLYFYKIYNIIQFIYTILYYTFKKQ